MMWQAIVETLSFLIRGESPKRRRYMDFIRWYRGVRVRQIRYSTLLTAVLYPAFNVIEFILGLESWPRLVFHCVVIPGVLVIISILSLFPSRQQLMQALLMAAPCFAVIANPLFNFNTGHFERFSPEIYLAIIWIFTISGLTLRPAFWTATVTVVGLIATTLFLGFSHTAVVLMLFWITAAFMFGVLGALVVEQANYALFLQRDHLLHSANSDALTGLWNRNRLTQLFLDHVKLSKPSARLSIIMIDIDFFKLVNDRYGHVVGDNVLKAFAELLRRNVRNEDMVSRIGGEEFCILLPGASVYQAMHVAAKLQEQISHHEFDRVGHKTASFGVTQYQEGETLQQCMARADRALYRAKHRGRNRVEVEPELKDPVTPP